MVVLIRTGIGSSFLELPTFASLWETSYGQALLVKIGLLFAALMLAGVNFARTKPRLQAGDPSAPLLLRRLVQGEIVLVTAALFAAAVLSSLAPPSSALAKVQDISARGPGPRLGSCQGPLPAAGRGLAEPGRPPAVLGMIRAADDRSAARRSSAPRHIDMDMASRAPRPNASPACS